MFSKTFFLYTIVTASWIPKIHIEHAENHQNLSKFWQRKKVIILNLALADLENLIWKQSIDHEKLSKVAHYLDFNGHYLNYELPEHFDLFLK